MQPPLVSFTSRYPGLSKILVNEVHVSSPVLSLTERITRPPDAKQYKALWDTGATGSVITRQVVEECGLKPIGRANVHHAKGTDSSLVFLVSIFLPSKVCFPSLRVTEGNLAGNISVLIGMDIMGRGDFAVSNKDGKTVFSFRMPSLECIDFGQQMNDMNKVKANPIGGVSRNAPCPCGSGKKYKRCCGK